MQRPKLTNGFIYVALKFAIDKICLLNLVEYFKKAGVWLNPNKQDRNSEAIYTRVATDIFIVLKWLFIGILLFTGTECLFLTISVWYLIVTNLYTYFFHHIWTDEALNTSNFTTDRIRRRFLNLLLAIAFSEMAFAYLYRFPYNGHYSWVSEKTISHAVWFSISNSLAANYDVIKPLTDFGNTVSMIQLVFTFIFVTIIISRSIPQQS